MYFAVLFRTMTDKLTFDHTNWNVSKEIYVVGVDDNRILESPYGGILHVSSESTFSAYRNSANLTLLVSDTDEGQAPFLHIRLLFLVSDTIAC